MSGKRTTTWASAAVLVVLLVLGYFLTRYQEDNPPTTGQPPTAGQSPTAGQPPVAPGEAADRLAALRIAPEGKMAGYSRDRFPHWSGQGNSCDTREVVLQKQGADVRTDKDCKATAGSWVSPYDGVTITEAGKLDIDHTVPLAEAWRSGADKWTDEQRQKFANDLGGSQLLAVSATTNRAKGDQDPAKWKPPVEAYWCAYATNWVSVKAAYDLTADQAEHDALAAMLGTCPR
ncbi:HNH endonuclease family protein [Saccharothrix obliqua]|uniref:HNH endonuclease family protein n=1 Tax=Saccharothrix obliqua TaxID=2861747 RepID=UPI001C5D804B|nr:HNH endonuclease family protein [Saccharothrix obliqua]MBW4720769.1 HNH endonuclease family protein [Saccharothrix obliqua]